MTPALVTALVGLAATLLGVATLWFKVNGTSKAVGSNGGSTLHDAIGELRTDVRCLRSEVTEQGKQIARLENRKAIPWRPW